LVFNDFKAELKKAITLIKDLKFTYSLIKAVDSNIIAIKESRVKEI